MRKRSHNLENQIFLTASNEESTYWTKELFRKVSKFKFDGPGPKAFRDGSIVGEVFGVKIIKTTHHTNVIIHFSINCIIWLNK